MANEVEVERDGRHGRAVRERHGWEVELDEADGHADPPATARLLDEVVDAIAAAGGGTARWRIPAPSPEHVRAGTDAGFDGRRRLVQMRRSLPAPPPEPPIATRPFTPGADDDEWLRVNGAAFAWHPEQGVWTTAELEARLAEPWFDPDGFLLHPDGPPGTPIDAFCWTKVHDELDPPVGEIFVIAVDPHRAGGGLGRRIVLAGLEHLAGLGLEEAMLYTERDNTPAMRLYESLGFAVRLEVQVFTREVADLRR